MTRKKLSLLPDKHLWTRLIQVPDVESHGRRITLALFSHQKSLGPGQSSPAFLLSPNSFDSWEPISEAKDLVVTLEKRTKSYLSVSARIRVIDQLSQMKREYNTTLDDADSANRNNFVPPQSFTSLRKHPFLLALRRWGSPAAKSEEKRTFSQARALQDALRETFLNVTNI